MDAALFRPNLRASCSHLFLELARPGASPWPRFQARNREAPAAPAPASPDWRGRWRILPPDPAGNWRSPPRSGRTPSAPLQTVPPSCAGSAESGVTVFSTSVRNFAAPWQVLPGQFRPERHRVPHQPGALRQELRDAAEPASRSSAAPPSAAPRGVTTRPKMLPTAASQCPCGFVRQLSSVSPWSSPVRSMERNPRRSSQSSASVKACSGNLLGRGQRGARQGGGPAVRREGVFSQLCLVSGEPQFAGLLRVKIPRFGPKIVGQALKCAHFGWFGGGFVSGSLHLTRLSKPASFAPNLAGRGRRFQRDTVRKHHVPC